MKLGIKIIAVHDVVDFAADINGLFHEMPRPARIAFPIPCLADPRHGSRQGIGVPVQVFLPQRAPIPAVIQGAAEHSLKLIGAGIAIGDHARNTLAPRLRGNNSCQRKNCGQYQAGMCES